MKYIYIYNYIDSQLNGTIYKVIQLAILRVAHSKTIGAQTTCSCQLVASLAHQHLQIDGEAFHFTYIPM